MSGSRRPPLYDLLFADDPDAFRPADARSAAPWQRTLYIDPPDAARIRALADDAAADSRVRLLAYRWLQRHAPPVLDRALLGVVVEVALEQGLDALAAYADGSARYLNHGGRVVVLERVDALRPAVATLLDAAAAVVAQIGPDTAARRPPPAAGLIRLTFLTADGVYLGEGPADALATDPLGGPVVHAATALLRAVVALAPP